MKKYNYLFKLMLYPWLGSLAVGAWATAVVPGGFGLWALSSTIMVLIIGALEFLYGKYVRKA